MKHIYKIVIVSTICLAFVGLVGQIVQAQQRPVSLFSTSCVKGGGRNAYPTNRELVIGREIFT